MRTRVALCLWAALTACLTPGAEPPPEPPLWTAPERAQEPSWLRIEPGPRVVAGLGESVSLRLRGRAARDAHCLWGDAGHGRGVLEVHSPAAPGVVEVRCRSGRYTAAAQVTFSDAAERPFADPYAGAALLLKLRDAPPTGGPPEGRASLGLGSLDRLLARLGAHALPAFPFDRSGTRDPVGLERWVAVVVPPGVNVYQAVPLLRADPHVHPESYLPVPLREAGPSPTPLGVAGERDRGMARRPSARARGHVAGAGIGIAVLAGALDPDDPEIGPRIRSKPWESDARDADGNGLPGDRDGADFRRLAFDGRGAAPRLALAPAEDARGGGGTRLARIALEFAPGAWLLPVGVRDDAWSRALGVVYAAAEGARLLTCDWPAQPAAWVLRDALAYAQRNCALAVCARDTLPGDWAAPGGSAWDAWSGRPVAGFFTRPLDAAVAAPAPGVTAGEGAAALSRRPDLGPEALSEALASDDPVAFVAGEPRGTCSDSALEAREAEERSFWERTKIKTDYGRKRPGGLELPPLPDERSDPASPDAP